MSDNHAGGGFANPTPAGLVALGMACYLFFALLTGRVDHTCLPIMGAWLLGGFIVQLIVGIIDLKEGNLAGGNIFIWFSAFFMFATGITMIFEFIGAQFGVHMDARIDGWGWVALLVSILLWTPAFLKQAPAYLSLALVVMDAAACMLVPMKLGILPAATYGPIIGWLIFVAGSLGLLLGGCMVLNTAFGREVIPCPGPLLAGNSTNQPDVKA